MITLSAYHWSQNEGQPNPGETESSERSRITWIDDPTELQGDPGGARCQVSIKLQLSNVRSLFSECRECVWARTCSWGFWVTGGVQPVIYIPRAVPHQCHDRPTLHGRAAEGSEGYGAEPCSPRVQPASSRGVSWEAREPERSHRSGGLHRFCAVWRLPTGKRGGPPCEPRERARARARGKGHLAHREHTCIVPWTTSPRRAESERRGRGKHTPRRATSTRTTRARTIAPEVEIIVNESTRRVRAASRELDWCA